MCKLVARLRASLAGGLIVSLVLAMCGCALIDNLSPRATRYNDETADTKSAAILLNVLRAAYSKPLQFSDVTTVSGVSSIGGNAGATTGAAFPTHLNTRSREL